MIRGEIQHLLNTRLPGPSVSHLLSWPAAARVSFNLKHIWTWRINSPSIVLSLCLSHGAPSAWGSLPSVLCGLPSFIPRDLIWSYFLWEVHTDGLTCTASVLPALEHQRRITCSPVLSWLATDWPCPFCPWSTQHHACSTLGALQILAEITWTEQYAEANPESKVPLGSRGISRSY